MSVSMDAKLSLSLVGLAGTRSLDDGSHPKRHAPLQSDSDEDSQAEFGTARKPHRHQSRASLQQDGARGRAVRRRQQRPHGGAPSLGENSGVVHRMDIRTDIWPGSLAFDSPGATKLLKLVSARYERGSIIMVSNKAFGEWGESFSAIP